MTCVLAVIGFAHVILLLFNWFPVSEVELDCIESCSLSPSLLKIDMSLFLSNIKSPTFTLFKSRFT